MLKSEGCKRASRSNMIPISNFFPLSRFIFFSPFFLYLFVLVVSTRERCILETSIDALEKRIASIHHYSDWCTINSAMYAHTATTVAGIGGGWTAISLIARFYPLCAILSATRDAPDAPRVLDFHRLSFIAAENIENIFVYRAPRTPSKIQPFTITAAGSKYGLHSSLVLYFNVLLLLFSSSLFLSSCFLCYYFPNTSFSKLF